MACNSFFSLLGKEGGPQLIGNYMAVFGKAEFLKMACDSFFSLLGKEGGPQLIGKYIGVFGKAEFLTMACGSFFSLLGKPEGAKVLTAVLSAKLPLHSLGRRISFIQSFASQLIECQHLALIYAKSTLLTLDEVKSIIDKVRLTNTGIISTRAWKSHITKSRQIFGSEEDDSAYQPPKRQRSKDVASNIPNSESEKENRTTTVPTTTITTAKRKRQYENWNFDNDNSAEVPMDEDGLHDKFDSNHVIKTLVPAKQRFAIGKNVFFDRPTKVIMTEMHKKIVKKLKWQRFSGQLAPQSPFDFLVVEVSLALHCA